MQFSRLLNEGEKYDISELRHTDLFLYYQILMHTTSESLHIMFNPAYTETTSNNNTYQ